MKGYKFNRQRPVLNYIADFMCKEHKLIIEVDGKYHWNDEVAANDKMRQAALENSGFTVLRFSNEDVLKNINGVYSFLSDWITTHQSASAPPPAPSGGGQSPVEN